MFSGGGTKPKISSKPVIPDHILQFAKVGCHVKSPMTLRRFLEKQSLQKTREEYIDSSCLSCYSKKLGGPQQDGGNLRRDWIRNFQYQEDFKVLHGGSRAYFVGNHL